MKKIRIRSHDELMKPYLKDRRLREKIKMGVKRLKVISQMVKLREKLGLTQAQLAARIGVSQPFIARIENDEASNLSLETLIKIVHALSADVEIKIRNVKEAA